MPTTVEVTGPGTVTGSKVVDGETWYAWTFPVVVDGQAGVYTIYCDGDGAAAATGLIPFVIEDLLDDPGAMEGITQNDPGVDGDQSDGDAAVADGGDNGGDDDGGALADGGGDTGAGDSV